MSAHHITAAHSATLLLASLLSSCQVADAIANAMRPQADQPGAQSSGPGSFDPDGSVAQAELAAGSSHLAGVEVIEQPDEGVRSSYARLIEARLNLPARPTPPPAPRLVPVGAEETVNTAGQLTTNGLSGKATLATGAGASHRVAVVSGDDRGRIEAQNAVPNFVADVFYGRLQRRGLAVLDCDYATEGKPSTGVPVESSARRGDTNAVDQGARSSTARATELGADHLIVLHAVPLPQGSGGLAGRTVTLPLEVDASSWSLYEAGARTYLEDVAAYNAAVTDYDTICREVQVALGSRIALLEYGDLPKAIQDERALHALKVQGEALLTTPQHGPEALGDSLTWSERLMLQGGMLDDTVDGELLLRAALLERGAEPLVEKHSTAPTPILDPERRLFRTEDEALLARLPERRVEAFEVAVSVRVIDLASSGAEWFGMATCRDLSLTAAVERTCDALIEAMLRP